MKNEYIPRLKIKYDKEVVSYLSTSLGINNLMRTPKLLKIVLNFGIGDAKENANWLKKVCRRQFFLKTSNQNNDNNYFIHRITKDIINGNSIIGLATTSLIKNNQNSLSLSLEK